VSPAFVGLLTDRLRAPNASNTNNKQSMGRMGFLAATDITSLKLMYAGYQTGTTGASEKGVTSATTDTMTVEASIEHPEGTFTRVRFAGADQGTLKLAPSTGATASENALWSDYAEIAIPRGAVFWVRTWTDSDAGILYHNASARVTDRGDFHQIGSAVANRVMGGTIGQTVQNTAAGPMAIVGPTDAASIILVGDSIMFGQGYAFNGADFRAGIIGTNLPVGAAHLNLGFPGAKSDDWYDSAVNGRELFQFATHMATNLGVNGTGTAEEIAADNTAIAALFPQDCVKYAVTLTPRGASSTDGWITTGGQTVSGSNATYVAYNALARAGVTGFDGYIEVRRGALEAPPDESGLWQNDAGSALTGDGLHPNTAGYEWVGLQGCVPASLWAVSS
jgi:hypothetical protein